MKSKNITYLPSLDHLRAFAALLIVFAHGFILISYKQLYNKPFESDHWIYSNNPLKSLLLEGHTAVALFMILSGFIFTYGALGHKINYFKFIQNRILRIYPLFMLLIIVGISTYSTFTLPSFLQTIFCFGNLPGSLNIGPLSAVFWSIAVEFQFYFLFPFIFKFLEKYNIKKVLNIIFIAILFRIISYLLNSNIRDVSYFTLLGRIDQFIIGMIVAKIYSNLQENLIYKKRFKILLIPSIILLFISLFIFNKLGGLPVISFWKLFWPTYEGIIWGFFILCYMLTFNSTSNMVSRALSKIGALSFPIYLIHYTIITIICEKNWIVMFSDSPYKNALINTLLLVLPITLLISIVISNTIEKPFLELRTKYLE